MSELNENGMQDQIVIRFAMTKGEGTRPAISQMNEGEKSDLRLMIQAALCFEDELLSVDSVKITELEFIYDGITALDGEDYGYRLVEGEDYLSGYPAPIIRFKTSVPVDPEEFRLSIFTSWFSVQTASMKSNDQEPYFAEDHNGYAAVLDAGEAEEWIGWIQVQGVCSGKRFTFPDGMPTGGHLIQAMDFALPPDWRSRMSEMNENERSKGLSKSQRKAYFEFAASQDKESADYWRNARLVEAGLDPQLVGPEPEMTEDEKNSWAI